VSGTNGRVPDAGDGFRYVLARAEAGMPVAPEALAGLPAPFGEWARAAVGAAAGGPGEALQAFLRAVTAEVAAVDPNADAPDEDEGDARLDLETLEGIVPEAVRHRPGGVLLRGELQLLAGGLGLGKTRILLEALAATTRGKAWPHGDEADEPGHVFYVGHEDDPRKVIRPVVVEALGGDPARFHRITAMVERTTRGEHASVFALTPAGLRALRAEMRRWRPKLLIIDPVTGHLGSSTDSYKDAEVRAALQPLADLAHDFDCAIVGNAHLNKDQQQQVLYRIGGAAAFAAVARAVFFAVKDPGEPQRRALFLEKTNLTAPRDALGFSIVGHQVTPEINVGIPTWDTRPVSFTLEDAFKALLPGETRREPERQQVLRTILAATRGRVLAQEAFRIGDAMGVHSRTLKRAKGELGIASRREGYGKGSRVYWVCPEATAAAVAWDATHPADGDGEPEASR
jgi:hypothetical protein